MSDLVHQVLEVYTTYKLQFYEYYFGALAQVLGLSLSKFIYPQPAEFSSGRYRSLNLEYFKQVFLCEQFVHDLKLYLVNEMRQEYELEVDRKTQQLLVKWDDQFTTQRKPIDPTEHCHGISKKLHQEISRYFLQNKRCKLPWSIAELNNAISRLNSLFMKLIKNEDPEIST
jgi:hypothetical protein